MMWMTMLNPEHDFNHERMLKKTKRPKMAIHPKGRFSQIL
jgi:hypothetical protein